jgi:hypothetical protein
MMVFVAAAAMILAGCDDDDDGSMKRFEVSVSNLTAHQPFSPVALLLHDEGYTAWRMGEAASTELEELAEGGSPDGFITSAEPDPAVLDTTAGSSPVGMGQTSLFEVMAEDEAGLFLTAATMLVNTNDAFTGLNSAAIGEMAEGEEKVFFTSALDAGTENNSEALVDVPGPAAGGEGYNPARNDQNIIIVHPGVVSVDDGLMTSALDESYRWDNPVAKITIRRVE